MVMSVTRWLVVSIVAASLAGCASAPTRSCYNIDKVLEGNIGFCQAIRSGKMLHVSGTVGAGAMPEATRQAYDALRRTLEANGLGFADVVKETVYTTDIEEFKKAGGIRKSYYGDNLPAATWVEVRRLFQPQFVVEIEVTAEYR
jgi:enamine deaminase RidA (YjgF/YER057c/UK114 family)